MNVVENARNYAKNILYAAPLLILSTVVSPLETKAGDTNSIPAPIISNAKFVRTGDFVSASFHVSNTTDTNRYTVETSTNFYNWEPVFSIHPGTNGFDFNQKLNLKNQEYLRVKAK
jgi:hypothetical protein